MAGSQNDEANRDARPPGSGRARAGGLRRACPTSGCCVSGNAAFTVDVTKVYSDGAPLIFVFVLGLSFLLMLVAFHSVVIPIKAILLNLLSTAAAYGVLVLVFQNGCFAGPLGITPSGVIESWVPLFIFTILFGLSMDYHLFILTRIKEARDRGLDSRRGGGQGHLGDVGHDHQRGLDHGRGLRGLRDPARSCSSSSSGSGWRSPCSSTRRSSGASCCRRSMTLLGDWNWWMPRFLDWIPRVTIEGDPDVPETAAPA